MNTKLKCLLLDDELQGLTYLKLLCEQIPELEVVKAFNNSAIFLNEIQELNFDLCILDIEMPGINGLEVAKLLNGKPVIFTTAHIEYAADAFDLDAIDYVRKPVMKDRLRQAVIKVIQRSLSSETEKKFIQLNTEKGKALVYFDQLIYIRTSDIDSRDKYALLLNNKGLLLKNISFDKLDKLLPCGKFCRVNKQEIIALHHVKYYTQNGITTSVELPDGKPLILTLGENYRTHFIRLLSL